MNVSSQEKLLKYANIANKRCKSIAIVEYLGWLHSVEVIC